MKSILMVFGALAGTLYSGWLLAVPTFSPLNDYEVVDGYWGGDDHGRGDVIGSRTKFDIQKAVFNRYADGGSVKLRVDIYTGFIANGGMGSFGGSTFNGRGIGLGDLFFSSTGWKPYRMSGDNSSKNEHYGFDNASNGTVWDYAFALGDKRWDSAGDGSLYEMAVGSNTDGHILLSQDFMSGGVYRNGQEVALELTAGSVVSSGLNGRWDRAKDGGQELVRFLLDVTNTRLATDAFGFHFGFSCANDVIEGDPPPVPEPALLGLLLAGFGLGGYRLKTK